MSSRRRAWAAVAAAIILAAPGLASCHAFLDRAEPRVGGRLRAAPSQVRLWFTERLEPAYSHVQVVNAAAERVDKGDGAVVADGEGRQLRISLAPLPPGIYRVVWRVLSVDTHVTEGDFTFRVEP